MTALAALRAGVVALLDDERTASGIVERAEVEIVGGERWSMGSREVTALRIALVVGAEDFMELERDPARKAAIGAAFLAAVRTPDSELAELFVVLRLPIIHRGWHHAYREAPPKPPERPSEEAMLAGAASLLGAEGDDDGARILGEAVLEVAEVSKELVRCVVRIGKDDLAALNRDPKRTSRLTTAVRAAATRADQAIASIELALLLT